MQSVEQKLAKASPKFKALIDRLRSQALSNKKPENIENAEQKSSPSNPLRSFAVYQAGAYIASDYALRNSIILNPATTLYIINNRARFIGDIQPASKQLYIGSGIENIKDFGTAEVTVITPLGKQKIHLIKAAYVPRFHTNLVCNHRLNNKGVF